MKAQASTAQARELFDQLPVGAQFLGGQRTLVCAVELTVASCQCDGIGLDVPPEAECAENGAEGSVQLGTE
jgi:hypothetical protein